ncbi:MAG: pilus assembly protein PilM [Candidatus Omnitrophica bacterium]|nr:pilus assembly protein PilM [Candidatus Omnitrophota bacterium]
MARTGVGLVLRPHAIEVVEVRQGFRGTTVTKHARVPLTATDDAAVIAAIRTAVETSRISTTRVAVTVPAQEVLLRSFRLPLIPKTEWNTAIQFEARKYIPFKTEELAWGFHAVEERSVKQLMVVFVGIRTESFERVQRVVAAAGLEATCLEAPWASLARLATAQQGVPDDQFLAVVEIEPSSMARIVIVKNQVPYLTRDVNLTSQETPADQPSVEPKGAEKLLSEIRLSFDFFTREHPSTSINQLLLFGNAATAAPYAAWLAQQLRCVVALGSLPLEGATDKPADLGLGLAVGLALRELRPSEAIKLDFAQRAAVPTTAPSTFLDKILESSPVKIDPALVRALLMPTLVSIGVAMAAVSAVAVHGHRQVLAAKEEFERTVRSFSAVGYGLASKQEDELHALQQLADRQTAFLRNTIEQRVSVTEKLDALAKALPEGVWLDTVTYQNPLEGGASSASSLTLQGSCFLPEAGNEVATISDFIQRIKADRAFFKGFATTKLVGIATAQRSAYAYRTFELNCQSERKAF